MRTYVLNAFTLPRIFGIDRLVFDGITALCFSLSLLMEAVYKPTGKVNVMSGKLRRHDRKLSMPLSLASKSRVLNAGSWCVSVSMFSFDSG